MRLLMALALTVILAVPAQAQPHWDIGYTVHTKHPSNVVVDWTLTCTGPVVGTKTLHARVPATTPSRLTFLPTVTHPTSCHIRVVAWNVPPGTQRPAVHTWVIP